MSSRTWPRRPNGCLSSAAPMSVSPSWRPRWSVVRTRWSSGARWSPPAAPAPRVTSPMPSAASWRNSACPGPSSRWRSNRRRPRAPAGFERVELRFAAGPGQSPAPLAKTASGGELSRAMLACRSVLADLDDDPDARVRRGRRRDRRPGRTGRRAAAGAAGARRARCSSSRTCRRSRASPTGTSACASTRAWPPSPCSTTASASPSSHACSPGMSRRARRRVARARNCSTRRCGSRPPCDARRGASTRKRSRSDETSERTRPACPNPLLESLPVVRERYEVHLRHGRSRLRTRQGHHHRLPRPPLQIPRSQGRRSRSSTRTSTSTPAR